MNLTRMILVVLPVALLLGLCLHFGADSTLVGLLGLLTLTVLLRDVICAENGPPQSMR